MDPGTLLLVAVVAVVAASQGTERFSVARSIHGSQAMVSTLLVIPRAAAIAATARSILMALDLR